MGPLPLATAVASGRGRAVLVEVEVVEVKVEVVVGTPKNSLNPNGERRGVGGAYPLSHGR